MDRGNRSALDPNLSTRELLSGCNSKHCGCNETCSRDELHHRSREGAWVELRGVEAEQPEPDCGESDEIRPNRAAGQDRFRVDHGDLRLGLRGSLVSGEKQGCALGGECSAAPAASEDRPGGETRKEGEAKLRQRTDRANAVRSSSRVE